jgi:hypothetical protein
MVQELPDFTTSGDLPVGVYRVGLQDVLRRFGIGGWKRRACTQTISHLFELAKRTGHLERFVIFGSYVTDKPDPNDVDVVLVMNDEFRFEKCPLESRGIFDHATAQARYNASVFWIRPGLLMGESLADFVASWQVKRDGSRRGIVEVVP